MEKPILKENHTTEDVKNYLNELKIYEKLKEKEKSVEPLKNPDFSGLIAICKSHIKELGTDEENDDDEHYIYEAALEAIYGNNVWKLFKSV